MKTDGMLEGLLEGVKKFVVETDEEDQKIILEVTEENMVITEGYRVRMVMEQEEEA